MDWKNNRDKRIAPCMEPTYFIGIDHNGYVTPCCHIRSDNPDHKICLLGNLENKSLSELFSNQESCIYASTYGTLLNLNNSDTNQQIYLSQGSNSAGHMYYRTDNSSTMDASWRTVLDSSNFSSYALGLTAKAVNSDRVDGLHIYTGRNTEANKIVRTDGNGYIQAMWINTTSGSALGTPTRIYCSQDDYLRYYSPAQLAPCILNQGSTKNFHTIHI